MLNFSKKIEETIFIFERVILENSDLMFFITNDIPGERSFFMVKRCRGNWEILYRSIVSSKILALEKKLSDAIVEMQDA